MDDGRLIVLAAAALVGCRGAAAADDRDAGARRVTTRSAADHAQPGHGIDVPRTWRAMPAIADAAVDAARKVVDDADVHAHAWGEPARGCYLAIVELRGARRDTIAGLERDLQAALEAGAELAEWTTSPDSEDASQLTTRFTAGAFRGRAQVQLTVDGRGMPRALAAACFYNDRHPEACDGACVPLLAMLAPPPVPTHQP